MTYISNPKEFIISPEMEAKIKQRCYDVLTDDQKKVLSISIEHVENFVGDGKCDDTMPSITLVHGMRGKW